MEADPASEWKIEEYSCSKEDEDEDEDGVVKWMLSKGYVIGRKMVITGIVISSAPLVPPLAVFSAMGVAFSVPFGLLFASYACTNKLMRILLPTSPPPSPSPMGMMEYYYTAGECKLGLEVAENDNQQMEDIYQGVDIVLELDDEYYRQDRGPTLMTNVGEDVADEMDNDRENVSEEEEREQMEDVSFNVAGDDQGEYLEPLVEDDYATKPVTVNEIDEPGHDENDSNSREVEELDLVARGDANKDERSIESDEKVLGESVGTQDGSEDAILIRTMEEHRIRSNADSRGLVLLDERNTNSDSQSLEVGYEVKENSAHQNVDVLARSPIKPAPLDKDNAKDASETYKKLSSREENLDDEKMWEKLGAMRAIVGYKAPSQATCLGELKALYVFTGVEPPASFEGDSNLDEVDVKLKFLMAIVGVK